MFDIFAIAYTVFFALIGVAVTAVKIVNVLDWLLQKMYKVSRRRVPRCEVCEGTGEQTVWYTMGGAEMMTQITCDSCDGIGVIK